jgi:hypothetical protein
MILVITCNNVSNRGHLRSLWVVLRRYKYYTPSATKCKHFLRILRKFSAKYSKNHLTGNLL